MESTWLQPHKVLTNLIISWYSNYMHETRARTIKLTVAIIIILGFIYKTHLSSCKQFIIY